MLSLKNIYSILFVCSALTLGCSENYHLTGDGIRNTSLGAGTINDAPILDSSSAYKNNGGEWETPISMKDQAGNPVAVDLINYELKECGTTNVYFNGDFDYEADLAIKSPVTVFINVMDWEDDVQPYFLSPSRLGDGSTLTFDKKAWADANNLNFHATENPTGKPITLCQKISVKNAQGVVIASTDSTYSLVYKHVFDNNTYADEIVSSFPFTSSQFATTGGIEYIENGGVLSSVTPGTCNSTNTDLYYLMGTNTSFSFVSAVKYNEITGYEQVAVEGLSTNDAISLAFDVEFVQDSFPSYGTNCIDYYNSLSQQVGYTEVQLKGVQIQNDPVNPTEVVRFKINVLESF